MLDCSANQGNGEAAYRLASYLKNVNEDSQGALKYYQLSTKNGYLNAAITLIDAFDPETTSKDYDYLSVKPDKERSSRYGLIRLEIRNNPEARFPDIDKIVPLPLPNSLSGMGPLNIKNRLKDNNHDLFLFIL
ncbi:DUF6396 domain-containing protein [Providencia vermicola]